MLSPLLAEAYHHPCDGGNVLSQLYYEFSWLNNTNVIIPNTMSDDQIWWYHNKTKTKDIRYINV